MCCECQRRSNPLEGVQYLLVMVQKSLQRTCCQRRKFCVPLARHYFHPQRRNDSHPCVSHTFRGGLSAKFYSVCCTNPLDSGCRPRRTASSSCPKHEIRRSNPTVAITTTHSIQTRHQRNLRHFFNQLCRPREVPIKLGHRRRGITRTPSSKRVPPIGSPRDNSIRIATIQTPASERLP